MSEINVAAIVTPKPEKFEEAAALITEVIQKVQANEPGTLLYSAFPVQGKKEIVIVERYKDQAAVKAHTKTPYFREFSTKIAPLLAKPTDIRAGSFLNGARGVARLFQQRLGSRAVRPMHEGAE
ncbi:hypothetical protein PDE_01599 [Penicillium oxalicum 114-2]|uniref:ABM domain-containing protein n=1 Tax=Penicillium oxalicum (strain 114-2 / CGMCC 5302) TaxID=933388 RepID=S7ZDA2_PENO1|nr:hypothetical protein PDE_01599 [Penicillium oxalicum 114-2]